MGGSALAWRVERVAEAVLAEQRYVSAIDIFLGLGWLAPTYLDEWRQGRVQCLELVTVCTRLTQPRSSGAETSGPD
ncbi:MAG: hypothetical protein M3460_04030 [Actinomycetota bacterium]|nr:hypothetical protein [Actinomycetota bacterium]